MTENQNAESFVGTTYFEAEMPSNPTKISASLIALASISACGGGGSGGAGTATAGSSPIVSTAPAPTQQEAANFAGKAGFGGAPALITEIQNLGLSAWLDAEFAKPRSTSHWDWMTAKGYNVVGNIFSFAGVDNTLWRKFMTSPDVLRQRITLALSEIFVVSMAGLPINFRGMSMAAYVDILEANAFGNYRTLLNEVTLSTGMGSYLNMRGNLKANTTGRLPDENYAREILQLFTIGLVQLNNDGSPKLLNGQTQETYNQSTISELAKVFTGWNFDTPSSTTADHVGKPMAFTASNHSPETKSFLGVNLPAGTDGVAELKAALDAIFNHPNVGPFFCKQLIQRLVTSNPSAAYVNRVATAFNGTSSSPRGDMKATIKAVFLDPEALTIDSRAGGGQLREPIVRLIQWARTFNVSSATDVWAVGDTSSASTRLGQSPLRSPSVFNFFRPGYVPPNTTLGAQGLTVPELQITNESTVTAYANYMQGVIQNGISDVKPDYSAYLPQATDANALFDTLNLHLASGQIGAATKTTIVNAVTAMSSSTDAQKLLRINACVLLIMVCPEYLVRK